MKFKKLLSFVAASAMAVSSLTGAMTASAEDPTTEVDKSALTAAIETAKGFNALDYTAASFEALYNAIKTAETLNSNEGAIQDDIDAAITAMTNAETNLVKDKFGKSLVEPDSQAWKNTELTNTAKLEILPYASAGVSVSDLAGATEFYACIEITGDVPEGAQVYMPTVPKTGAQHWDIDTACPSVQLDGAGTYVVKYSGDALSDDGKFIYIGINVKNATASSNVNVGGMKLLWVSTTNPPTEPTSWKGNWTKNSNSTFATYGQSDGVTVSDNSWQLYFDADISAMTNPVMYVTLKEGTTDSIQLWKGHSTATANSLTSTGVVSGQVTQFALADVKDTNQFTIATAAMVGKIESVIIVDVPIPDTTVADVQAIIDEAGTYDSTIYTEESFAALTAAVNDAKAVIAKENPTPFELDEALTSVKTAIKGLSLAYVAVGECGDNVKWKLDDQGVLFITGAGSMYTDKTAANQWTFYNQRSKIKKVVVQEGVTTIGPYAFYHQSSNYSNLESVTLPSTITSIEKYAFAGLPKLTSIEIPGAVKTIGDYAFYNGNGKSALESITLNEGLESIGQNAFSYCNLTSISIPSTVTSIGQYAFSSAKLTSITVPKSVTSIGSYAFSSNESLTELNLPSTLTEIPEGLLSGCSSLTNITLPEGVTSIGSYALSSTGITSYTVPGNVTLGNAIFSSCTSLTEVTLPEDMKVLPQRTFSGCTSLTGITLPKELQTIGEYAFQNSGLTSITIPESITSIEGSAFAGTKLTSVTIPETITEISNYLFSECSDLTEVNLPSKLTKIGNYAFNRTGLTSFNFTNSITEIGSYAFAYCANLTEITLPKYLTTLGGYAFRDCTSLTNIKLPNTLTTLNSNSHFRGCTALKSITIPQLVESIPTYFCHGCTSLESVYIYSKNISVVSGASTASSRSFDTTNNPTFYIYEGESGEATATETALTDKGYTNISYMDPPASDTASLIAAMGEAAKYKEDDYTADSYAALSEALAKADEIIEDPVATQDDVDSAIKAINDAIEGLVVDPIKTGVCGNNVTWTLNRTTGVLTISGTGPMFDSNSSDRINRFTYSTYAAEIKEVVFEDGVTTVGDYAFNNGNNGECPNLTKVTLSPTVATIGVSAFAGSSVETIDFENVTLISDYAFMNSKIKSVDLHSGLTVVGRAFENCDEITEITIPDGVKLQPGSIGSMGGTYSLYFANCDKLEKVTIEEGVTDIGNSTFTGCSALKSVVINTKDIETVNKPFDEENEITFTLHKNSNTQKALIEAAYITDDSDNVIFYPYFGDLEELISEVNGYDMSVYTSSSVAILKNAILLANLVANNQNATQADIDAAISTLDAAKAAIAYKSASYTAVDEAIAKVPTDLSKYTDASVQALNDALNAVDRDKNITEQDVVDGYVTAINEAIEGLVEKSTEPEPTKPEPSKSTTATATKVTATTRSAKVVAADKAAAEKLMKQAKIKKLTVKSKVKKKITVTWKKVKKAVGYEVEVSTSKNFKKSVLTKTTTKKKLVIKNKKIKSGKKYFVRVRAYATYKDANGTAVKVYSAWNKKLRTVKVK